MDKEIDFFNIEDNYINGNGTISSFDRLLSNISFLIYSGLMTDLKANKESYKKIDMTYEDDLK